MREAMTDRPRILVVDDTPITITILTEILKDTYDVSVATSGQQCLDFVFDRSIPDLILLDIMMPEMDGYEVCQRLKESERSRDIPVIFVTAKSETEDETRGLDLGAVDYITKPVSPPIVLARVRNHIQFKKQNDQLKESVSFMEHEAEMLQQKAELGIQAGGLAHDINNILTGCMIIELMPESLPEDFPEKQTLLEDIDMVLDSVRLGAEVCQGYTSYLRDIGSEATVQPVLPLLQPIDMFARKFKGEIIKDFARDLPALCCKGYQVKRVLVNLFANACQAVEDQKNQVITVKAWSEDDQLVFSVRDNGAGIPAGILPEIFNERFTTKEQGTGLGLFMVKEIVDSHNGTIQVDAEKGKDTVFTVSFPIADEQYLPAQKRIF